MRKLSHFLAAASAAALVLAPAGAALAQDAPGGGTRAGGIIVDRHSGNRGG